MDLDNSKLSEKQLKLLRKLSADDDAYQQLVEMFTEQRSNESFWQKRYEDAAHYIQETFDNHQAIKLVFDPETGRIVNANNAALQFYGYSRKQMFNLRIQDINVSPREIINHEIQEALTGRKTYFQFRHRLANGDIRDVDVFASPVDTDQGRLLYSIIVDTTQIQEAKLRYSALFEQSNDAVFILDLQGNHVQVNHRACDLLGYTPQELTSLSFKDIVVPTQMLHSRNVLESLLEGKKVAPYEREFRHKDGQHIYVEINAEIVYGPNNTPLHIQSVVRDITERKAMEIENEAFLDDMKALQEIHLELSEIDDLQKLYLRMIELTHERLAIERVALFVLDKNQQQLRGTFGTDQSGNLRDESYYSETIDPDHWTIDILHSHHHTKIWWDADIFDNAQVIGKGWKAATTLWNGHRAIGYLVCDSYVTNKKPRRYQEELLSILGSTFGHLIERKEIELALKLREEQLQIMFDHMPVMVGVFDRNGQIQFTNKNWDEVLGYDAQELRKMKHPTRLFFPDTEERHRAVAFMHSDNTDWFEMRVHTRDRGVLEITWAKVELSDGRTLGIGQDITQRKVAQQREFEMALQSQRIDLLMTFIQDAAHEFRTPLSIIGSSSYLMARSDDLERRRDKEQQISNQIKRITRLVDSLLTMAKLEKVEILNLRRVNVASILDMICENLSSLHEGNTVLIHNYSRDMPRIMADDEKLSIAFEQIIQNAYRYTPDGGTITVDMQHSKTHIHIDVQDTGIGISDEDKEHVFEYLWRKDAAHTTPGFGLGLSIALKAIELHGGSISVESKLGEGTTFHITLPIEYSGDTHIAAS